MAEKKYIWRNGHWINMETMEVVPESQVPDEYKQTVTKAKAITITQPTSGKTKTTSSLSKDKQEIAELKKKLEALRASLKRK